MKEEKDNCANVFNHLRLMARDYNISISYPMKLKSDIEKKADNLFALYPLEEFADKRIFEINMVKHRLPGSAKYDNEDIESIF